LGWLAAQAKRLSDALGKLRWKKNRVKKSTNENPKAFLKRKDIARLRSRARLFTRAITI
jgi:hypothetical protein